jgi:hypothetical protein
MALASLGFMTRTGGYTTTLANKLDKIDCSQVLDAVLLKDTALLGHIKMGTPGTTIEHNWIEDELNAPYIYAKFTAGTTKLTIVSSLNSTATVGKLARKFAILQKNGGEGQIQITSTLSGTMTVADYGNTTNGTQTTVTKWWVIAQPYTDIADASDDISKSRSKKFNFYTIFERALAISKTRENMDMEAVVNELQLQIERRTMEIKRELNISVLRSRAYYSSGFKGRVERSTMAGIDNFLWDPDLDATEEKSMVTQVSGALTVGLINSLAYKIFDAGGMDESSDPIIVVGAYQARIIAAFERELRRVEQGERQTGYYRNVFLTDMGKEMPIVIDRWAPADKLYIIDRSRISLIPLQGDSWGMEKMAKTGRSTKWQLSGQYTLEMRYPDKCHGALYDLSYA